MCIFFSAGKKVKAALLSYFLLREGKLPGIGDWRSEYRLELIADRNLMLLKVRKFCKFGLLNFYVKAIFARKLPFHSVEKYCKTRSRLKIFREINSLVTIFAKMLI